MVGIIDSSILQLLLNGSVNPQDEVAKAMNKNFKTVSQIVSNLFYFLKFIKPISSNKL